LLFACISCDSPAISVEGELSGRAAVKCGGCDRLLGTWSQVQQVAAQVLAEEGIDAVARSADPLPVSLVGVLREAYPALLGVRPRGSM
jgi:hypothetical protein